MLSTSTAIIRLTSTDQPLPNEGPIQFDAPVVAKGQGLYYGLAQDHLGRIWVAARCSLVSDSLPTEAEQGRLVPLSRREASTGAEANDRLSGLTSPRALRDLHDAAAHAGALWSICSYDDAVGIYRFEEASWTWWHPLERAPSGGPDQYHFNSLCFEDDLVWVLAHRRGPSWLLAFPVAAALAGQTVPPVHHIKLGQQAHNIWRQPDGELCTCSSIEGVLLGERGWRLETGGFPRGVAKLADGWVVGVSALKERRERDFSDAHLLFYDGAWQLRHKVTLPKVGMVLDLLPIPRSEPLPVVGAQPVVVD